MLNFTAARSLFSFEVRVLSQQAITNGKSYYRAVAVPLENQDV